MRTTRRKRSEKRGLPPGTPVYVGEERAESVRITVIDYNAETFEQKDLQRAEECVPFRDRPTVTWINVDGLHEVDVIEKIGKAFDLHPLILEDIANTNQRPKLEDYANCLYVVIQMFSHHVGEVAIEAEQVSLVLGPNFVISFQERQGDVFDIVRDRIRNAKGRVRGMGADYLLYSLMDAIVDGYFQTCEELGEEVEELEDSLLRDPRPQAAAAIHQLKREVIFLRKSIWPLREVINGLMRGESKLIRPETVVFLRDVYDHTIQVIDTVESARDIIAGLLDIYLSSISNRMNEVMKVLTIIATVFIPLTFIAGVYGMNFHDMPELGWRYGYPAVLAAMAAVAGAMVLFFRRRGWL
jgi:magnesium transporter